MKRAVAFVLAIIVLLSLSSCGNMSDVGSDSNNNDIKGTEVETKSKGKSSKVEAVCDSEDAFDYVETDGGIEIIEFKNIFDEYYSKIIIPSQINGKDVIGIGSIDMGESIVFGAISSGPCEVVIPDTVIYIWDGAFKGVDGITKLSGGENCNKIGEYAFLDCVNLEEVTFIDNVTDLSSTAFAGCTALEVNH